MTLESVLPEGQCIDVSEKIGLSYGGCSREDTVCTHDKLKDELTKAALATRDPLLGFDFISPDITADPDTVKWGIIECNSVPFINLHHDPLEGVPVNVAAAVWDFIEKERLNKEKKNTYRPLVLFAILALIFAALPWLWHGKEVKKDPKPMFGEVSAVYADSFVLKNKNGKELKIFLASTTKISEGLEVGSKVQVFVDPVVDDKMEAIRITPLKRP